MRFLVFMLMEQRMEKLKEEVLGGQYLHTARDIRTCDKRTRGGGEK